MFYRGTLYRWRTDSPRKSRWWKFEEFLLPTWLKIEQTRNVFKSKKNISGGWFDPPCVSCLLAVLRFLSARGKSTCKKSRKIRTIFFKFLEILLFFTGKNAIFSGGLFCVSCLLFWRADEKRKPDIGLTPGTSFCVVSFVCFFVFFGFSFCVSCLLFWLIFLFWN